MSWTAVNAERREKSVPKVPTTPSVGVGMGGAISRRIAKVAK